MPYLDIHGNHDAFVMIQTVRDKFGMFTEKQVEKAIESRDMQAHMAHPTYDNFKQLVISKFLDNCYVVASDVTNARTLFGPNRPGLRGFFFDKGPSVLYWNIWIFHKIIIDCNILLL